MYWNKLGVLWDHISTTERNNIRGPFVSESLEEFQCVDHSQSRSSGWVRTEVQGTGIGVMIQSRKNLCVQVFLDLQNERRQIGRLYIIHG